MFITGLGTATPPQCYSQQDCWEVLQTTESYRQLNQRAQAVLKKVLRGDNGIRTRHLALDDLRDVFQLTPDTLYARYTKHAPVVATEAAERALAKAGSQTQEIDAIIVSTCTGYLCPGLTSYVSERLGLRRDVLALDLVGQGCGAALPNLRTADALIASQRAKRVLSICVEICSAAFYLDENLGVLISACLFGDGAAAAVLAGEPNPHHRRIEWKATGTTLSAADREYLRMEQRGGMLRNLLSVRVPNVAAKHAETVLADVLARAAVDRERIAAWILHPGGREVLAALRDKLGLAESDLRWSADILRDYGNLSSPSVLFVLEAALADTAPNGLWWMSSFGAGFSCHGALLEVTSPA